MNDLERLRDHPVFICGHPKSGTTLLRSLLDNHPQLVVYPDETFFFRGLLPEVKSLGAQEKASLAERYLLHYFSADGLISTNKQAADHSYEEYAKTCRLMAENLQSCGLRHDGDLLALAILSYAQAAGLLSPQIRYWVEKTPYNEHYAPVIFDYWPEARCIHVVRDPRDNYATYNRKHPGLEDVDFAQSWNASLRRGLKNAASFGERRYLIIRYEDLLQNPEEFLAKITAFLGIDDHPSLRQPTNRGRLWEGNSMFNERFSGISASPIGRWKTNLKESQQLILENLCVSGMKHMGYASQGRFSVWVYSMLGVWFLKQTRRLPGEMKLAFGRVYNRVPRSQ